MGKLGGQKCDNGFLKEQIIWITYAFLHDFTVADPHQATRLKETVYS